MQYSSKRRTLLSSSLEFLLLASFIFAALGSLIFAGVVQAAPYLVLKPGWPVTGQPAGESGVLIADVNGDGLEEIIRAGAGWVRVFSPAGAVLWQRSDSALSDMAKPQMADLDGDGKLEIILNINHGAMALRCSAGLPIYWRNDTLSMGKHKSSPVVADIDGSGHPTVFVASYSSLSDDPAGALDGRITSLSYDGKVLHQAFTWRPCFGGLSLADADRDGHFEVFMGDRNSGYGDGGYGRGVRCFWAENLTIKWERPEVLCSSHVPVLIDVNNDGLLEVCAGQNGNFCVLDSRDGSFIRPIQGDATNFPIHFQPSAYDIDRDGHPEILMADGHDFDSDDVVAWDLTDWQLAGRIYVGKCYYGPKAADVTGDGIMELIACSYGSVNVIDKNFTLLAKVSVGGENYATRLTYAVVQDIDGDGYLELVVSSYNGSIWAFDTLAGKPSVRVRTEVQHFSERRLGAAEFVPKPSLPEEPIISNPSPANRTNHVPLTLTELTFNLKDYQHDLMQYTVTTNPNIGGGSGSGHDGTYSVTISNLQQEVEYTWQVSATDGTHSNTVNYTFNTFSLYLLNLTADSDFSASVDSADLRDNGAGQDWYESRGSQPGGDSNLLFLDTSNIGGDNTKKAGFIASETSNAYLTQEFSSPQTGVFTAQWDIYVDSILAGAGSPYQAGIMMIGIDSGTGPNRNGAGDRFVYMVFSKPGGGTSGPMDLVASGTTVAANLNLKQWYTIKVIVNVVAGTYDVYVNGEFKATVSATTALASVEYISFAQWDDGAGAFYVDNASAYVELIGNQAPTIDSYSPTSDPTILEGESQQFSVTYHDLEGDATTVQWYLNGTPTVTTNSYTFQAVSGSAGTYDVNVTITDEHGAQTSRVWKMTVFKTLPPLLVDSALYDSVDSADLRADGAGQDWYESRNNVPTLLYLDESNVGGNTGKKAGFTAGGANAYLTQEFSSPQTGIFTVQWDIYVDSILAGSDNGYKAGIMMIGDAGGAGPNRANRFVYMAFYQGGTLGTMDLKAVSPSTPIAAALNLKQWYTIKVIVNVPAGTYDVYVDGAFKATVNANAALTSLTHISFAEWDDGDGAFYVDNVFAPAVVTHTITASADSSCSIDPRGSVAVADGVDQSFTIAADPGYVIADVLVDGGSVGPVAEYTFPAVSKDHTIAASARARLFADGFESGSFNAWSGVSGSPVVQSSVVHDGTFAMQAAASGRSCYKTISESTVNMRAYFYVDSASASVELMRFTAGSNIVALVKRTTTGGLQLGYLSGTSVIYLTNAAVTMPLDSWHCIELHAVVGASGEYSVWLDGVEISAFHITGVDNDNYGSITSTRVGCIYTSGTANVYVDCAVVSNSYIGPEVIQYYTLTVNYAGSGSVTKNPDQTSYASGTVVELTAVPASGWSFIGWSGDLTGSTNPTTFPMNGNKVVTATFGEDLYPLTVSYAGSGSGLVTKNPDKTLYALGESVVLTANPAAGSSFAGWSGDFSSAVNPVTVIINGTTSVTATFTEAVIFSDGFENGLVPPWSGTSTVPPIVQSSVVHDGTFAMQAAASGRSCYKTISESTVNMRAYFYVDSASASVELMRFTAGSTTVAFIKRTSTGALQFAYLSGGSLVYLTSAAGVLPLDEWHCIELRTVIDASGAYSVWLDGVEVSAFHVTGVDNDNYGSITSTRVGCIYTSGTANVYVDDAVVSNSYIGP